MKRTYVFIIFSLIATIAMQGCTAKNITTAHGMNIIESSTQLIAMSMLSADNQKEINAGGTISWEYVNKVTKTSINADVKGIDAANIQRGTLIIVPFDQDKAIKALFSGNKSDIKKSYEPKDHIQRINLKRKSSYGEELIITPASFSYINYDLMMHNYSDGVSINGNPPIMRYTKQQAEDRMIPLLSEMGIDTIKVSDVEILYSDATKEAFYKINFCLAVNNVSFENTNGTCPNLMKLTGSAIIGDEGLGLIKGTVLLMPSEEEHISELLTVDNVLKILPSYIDAYYSDIPYINITSIELNYCAVINEINQIVFYPVWVFKMNTSDRKDGQTPTAIIVNATTGQLETLD